MDNIRTIYMDMPTTIRAYTIADGFDYYTIVINSRISTERALEAYKHELSHIRNGDIYKECSADLIEFFAHQ